MQSLVGMANGLRILACTLFFPSAYTDFLLGTSFSPPVTVIRRTDTEIHNIKKSSKLYCMCLVCLVISQVQILMCG